ncbi:uncharacterized protein At1g51745-like [Magnolia sinica]|uniref:uncharacterized protein At1g51745-like n=1 Tax=Magnolia sinica TaxID=86752 RepID=UPI0026599387|nr:uncharacterized protein At1g51745-like [Magnolia sinica]
MGISEGLEGGLGIDCSVGAIVWVRRRNGSWWPGRILGPDELSASHVMSPRSGTPVKLLGREDASVDWYNLEKSKRVKAFRCGEFDDSIERAESSQGIPIKKREKYARREDAILHALELERQHFEKKQQKLGIASNYTSYKVPAALRKELGSGSPSENYFGNDKTRDQCKYINLKTQPLSKRLDSSCEGQSMSNLQFAQKIRHAKQKSWEDDKSEAIPRMRGLQDFGLRIAPSKRKLSASIAYGSSQGLVSADDCAYALPSGGHNIGTTKHASIGKTSSAAKMRKSQGGLTEEPLTKKRDRRRPLVQVLQSSAKLPDFRTIQSDGITVSISVQGEKEQADAIYQSKRSRCVYLPVESNDCLDHTGFPSDEMKVSPSQFGMDTHLPHPGSLAEENTSSGLIEARESDSETDYSDPDMDEEAAVLSEPRILGRSVSHGGSAFQLPEQPGNMDNEELDESELSSYVSQLHSHEQAATVSADMGGSNWQLKGKRNIRNLIKRPMEVIDGRDSFNTADKCNGSMQGSFYDGGGDIIKMAKMDSQMALRQGVYRRHEELNYAYDEGDLIENDLGQTQMLGFGNRRYPSMLKAGSKISDLDQDSHEMAPSVWEADRISQAALRGYRKESDDCFDPIYAGLLGDRMGPMLIDVDLKVQASYQGERVPLVSLMSRLNGEAIVGHPIQIEILEDGSSGLILSTDAFCEESLDSDGNKALPPVWRTARRTTMHRIPRPHPSSALEGEEVDPLPYSDIESKPPLKKPLPSHVYHKERLVKNSHVRRLPAERKSPKKIMKKISLSSQKTRTLSSIATEQKVTGKKSNQKISGNNGDLGSSIKSEKAAPPVTCISVKLVLSRILEAVSRPPSKAV